MNLNGDYKSGIRVFVDVAERQERESKGPKSQKWREKDRVKAENQQEEG